MSTTILIVEDEGLIALDLKRKLEQADYLVPAIADTATMALAHVKQHHPDLVLMDIRLRGSEDGINAAEQIRRKFNVPVIFVTAHADIGTLARARITEPFGYIVKPFHGVDFRAQIEIALWKHKMEQKLRASEAWLAATLRNVSDALIATDTAGNIVFMNASAAELTCWDCEEAKGHTLLDVFQVFEDATGSPVLNPVEAMYAGTELTADPVIFRLSGRGAADWILIEAAFSANRDGETLFGVVVVFHDISARRKAEEKRLQLQKLASVALLSAGVGKELADTQTRMEHSLRQLIAATNGARPGLVEEINHGLNRQQSIIQKLMTLGTNDPGEPVLLDVNEVLRELETGFRKSLGAGRIFSMKLQSGIPLINADPRQLRENLNRLIVETREATEPGDSVEIATTTIAFAADRAGVQVSLRDTGKGIRPIAMEHVFDPYYQSRPGGDRNPGLSLALLDQFVESQGGRIDVESNQMQGPAYLMSFPAPVEAPTAG